jgi:Tfp pilus assembly protein PilX
MNPEAIMPRQTSKTATIQRLLRRPKGASLTQLQTATQWQPHSLRAALSRLRKTGYAVERLPAHKSGGARYRIAGEPAGPGS